jgi:hypothetical protein
MFLIVVWGVSCDIVYIFVALAIRSSLTKIRYGFIVRLSAEVLNVQCPDLFYYCELLLTSMAMLQQRGAYVLPIKDLGIILCIFL